MKTLPVASTMFLAVLAAAEAGAATHVTGTIGSDTTWTAANSPYVVTGNVTVNAGVTLTIEPGVVVKVHALKNIVAFGRIVADGTPSARIVFTSIRDDSIGGDTGGDGATVAARGDWDGLILRTSSTGLDSSFRHVDVVYGGAYLASVFTFASRSNVTVEHSSITEGARHGLVLQGKNAAGYGLVLTLNSSEISDNGLAGLVINHVGANVSGATIARNGSEGMKIDLIALDYTGAGTTVADSTIHGNRLQGIAINMHLNLAAGQKPVGHHNNIYGNNTYGSPYNHDAVQLTSNKQCDECDWSENYFGENTASKFCSEVALRRRHMVIYTDTDVLSPVTASSFENCTRDALFTENPAFTPY